MAIKITELNQAINQELTVYSNHVIQGVKNCAKDSVRDLVKKTKATAPVGRRKKHYKDSITSKKIEENDRSISYLWYVKGSDYRLSHLLENGHALRNGGRTKGTHFIKNAETQVVKNYQKKVEEVIKNG